MNTYIALFRGINVGGHNKLPMKQLRSLLKDLGFQNIATYIQSGNVVFQSAGVNPAKIAVAISAEVEEKFGFNSRILILTLKELEDAAASNPFPEAETDASRLYLYFLASKPGNPNLGKMENIKKVGERFVHIDRVFYLHAPQGVGRSKLAANVEKLLCVPATSRNWRTVGKIIALAANISE